MECLADRLSFFMIGLAAFQRRSRQSTDEMLSAVHRTADSS